MQSVFDAAGKGIKKHPATAAFSVASAAATTAASTATAAAVAAAAAVKIRGENA